MSLRAPQCRPEPVPVAATTVAAGTLLRQCACQDKEETLRRRSRPGAATGPVPPIVQGVLRAPGTPLDPESRADFARRFGHDFAQVRIHADDRAAASARAVNAEAYTVGHHIVFAAGAYAPASSEGRVLLAHELVHTLQAVPETRQTPAALRIGGADDHAEHEADRIARIVDAPPAPMPQDGNRAPVVTDAAPLLRRQETAPRSKDDSRKERTLRALARRPADALHRWRALKPQERSVVLQTMTDAYGAGFTAAFQPYAEGKKKPNLGSHHTNTEDPKALAKRGYRLASDPGGIRIYVHPSGHEVWLIGAGRATEPEPAPEPEPTPPTPSGDQPPDPKQCVEPCDEATDDTETCKACCEAEIPETEARCLRICRLNCEMKL